jgi:hypothetical protein
MKFLFGLDVDVTRDNFVVKRLKPPWGNDSGLPPLWRLLHLLHSAGCLETVMRVQMPIGASGNRFPPEIYAMHTRPLVSAVLPGNFNPSLKYLNLPMHPKLFIHVVVNTGDELNAVFTPI